MRILLAFLLVLAAALPTGAAGRGERALPQPGFLKIGTSWSGEAPALAVAALPQWRQRLGAGCIGDAEGFAAFWKVFKPGTIPPRLDFTNNLVVFVAREAVYEQLVIVKVTLKEGMCEVVANGNRSESPRQDRLSVAAAVIPRGGIKFLRVGGREEPLEP